MNVSAPGQAPLAARKRKRYVPALNMALSIPQAFVMMKTRLFP